MSVTLTPRMSLEAFLDWESRQPAKYEFDGFGPVAMTGGTWNHAAIQRNLIGLLYNRLRGHRYQAIGSELKIQTPYSIRYSDAFVVCSHVHAGALVVTDPVIVFEILSESTSYTDRIEKNREYRATASIQRYVILEQAKPAATLYVRVGEAWVTEVVMGDSAVDLPEIGASLALTELYEGVEFVADTPAAGYPRRQD